MNVPVFRFTGVVYRVHHPMWAFRPLSGEGAKRYGGRFNRPGTSALYASLDPTTAWMEAQQGFPFKPQPMTLIAYQVDCTDLVDLTDTSIRETLNMRSTELGCAWEYLAARNIEPPTWILANQLKAQNLAGIRIRSFAPGCSEDNHNFVLWQWSNTEPHKVQVIDDLDRLPKTRDSWQDGELD